MNRRSTSDTAPESRKRAGLLDGSRRRARDANIFLPWTMDTGIPISMTWKLAGLDDASM
jgi:hypothetical protein